MTFRLPRVFDQHYTCPTTHDQPDHPTDLDDATWSCRICRQSLRITVLDRAGKPFLVERRPARVLTNTDQVVYWTGVDLTAGAVISSESAEGNGAGWYLAVEGFGGCRIDPGQYIARQLN